MDDNNFWLGLWTIIAVVFISVAALLTHNDLQTKRIAFENGYQKVSLIGQESPQWQKVK